jgi:aminopeptidase
VAGALAGTDSILDRETLARYADAIVSAGVGLRRRDLLVVHAQPAHRELVVELARAAYRRGARHVELEIDDPLVSATRYRDGSKAALGVRAPWARTRARTLMEPDAAIVHVSGDGDPGALDGIAPSLLTEDQARIRKQLRSYVRATLDGRTRWAIAAWETPPWARQVYPEVGELAARRRLARDLAWFCRVASKDDGDTSTWVEHSRMLETRARKLTRLPIERIELRGPGTELTLPISPDAVWLGGRERTASGRITSPNMPTEEVFTSPVAAGVEGTFRCSRPLVFRGRTIEGLAGELRSGRLVRLEATRKADRELVAALLDTDAGAKRIGEVALVDSSSRIGRTGRVYFNTLLDENAAAHIAFGAAYTTTHPSRARWANRSSLHLDVMIGTDDLEATAIGPRGRRIPLIDAGVWAV